MSRKVIITAAITGAIHTPTMSPYLPLTPEDIAQQAIDAARAGAASVHIHARNPETGMPSPEIDVIKGIVDGIRERCPLLINISTAIGIGVTKEQR
ncbi:MAG: 3-keto-5-aminohexanoate cleavage protein, partial [Proteobacteria bacterium]|nr:3-keto-5-aminohexanoate cleavage protein [Pseudomonadota bacterium]